MRLHQESIHTFAAERRRAAAGDRDAAARYMERALRAENDNERHDLLSRAAESIASAEANELSISRRLRGKR